MLLIYNHDLDQAKDYTKRALRRLEKEKLPPTPVNFELWYVYYANLNQDVKRAIDILTAGGSEMTSDQCMEIYQHCLRPDESHDDVRLIGDQIQRTLRSVTSLMDEVKLQGISYSGSLESATEQIGAARTLEELESMVTTLVRDTKSMLEHNEVLEKELDSSSNKMMELQSNLEVIRQEAYTDALTGLKNRKAFDEKMDEIISMMDAEDRTFSILLLDIDHFKAFNDNYGHQTGDQVLRLLARTLIEGIKGRDTACRFGGEEFVVLLPDTNIKAAQSVANALREAISEKEVVNKASQEKLGRMTVSIGAAEHLPGESKEEMLERADEALYKAKGTGRNKVVLAQGSASDKAQKTG